LSRAITCTECMFMQRKACSIDVAEQVLSDMCCVLAGACCWSCLAESAHEGLALRCCHLPWYIRLSSFQIELYQMPLFCCCRWW
jgi:hypothetical protein